MDVKNILSKVRFKYRFDFEEIFLKTRLGFSFLLTFPLKMNKIFLIFFLVLGLNTSALAHGADTDFLRSTGMIYCVIAVIAVVILGLAWYLMRLEKKINKLEKKYNNG